MTREIPFIRMARATRDPDMLAAANDDNLYASLAERQRIDRIIADIKRDKLIDRLLTCAVLFVVAAFIGAMLAVGGAL